MRFRAAGPSGHGVLWASRDKRIFTAATFHRNTRTACPKFRSSRAAHCQNSTGGTALSLLPGPRHLWWTRPISPGLHNTVAEIFAIFEGYDCSIPM
jgi:hypothetical protein